MGRVIRLGSAHRSCERVTFRADFICPDLVWIVRTLSAYVSPAYRPFRHVISADFTIQSVSGQVMHLDRKLVYGVNY